jgi:hypothetical protein
MMIRKALLLLLLTAAPASAHDLFTHYDRSEWQADVCRGRELARISKCEAALLSEARRQFDQFDQQILTVYIRDARLIAPAQPGATPPRP